MPQRNFETEKKEAEVALKFAEESFGANHPMVAARLENLALVLREQKSLLDAANLEAKAKVIRSKYNDDEILSGSHQLSGGDQSNITSNNSMSQYKILSKVGSGGMGTVYRATHEKIDKLLAVKVLSTDLVNSKSTRRRFQQEVQASCNLTHPHLVSVYDFGISDRGAPYLVMDFIDGVTLSQEIKDLGFIEKERALNIAIQLCEGIAHAHMRAILHRDLKPSNIILSEIGESKDFVKVVDFGLAKLMPTAGTEGKTMTSTSDVMGSPLYMSPEQCMGEQLDQRADIYSIGCVMHEMFTGKPPFDAPNTIKIIFQHINADRGALMRRLSKFKLQPGMEAIILRCLEKKPQSRYQNVNELLRDLQLVSNGKKPGFMISKQTIAALAMLAVTILGTAGALIARQTAAPATQQSNSIPITATSATPPPAATSPPGGIQSPGPTPDNSTSPANTTSAQANPTNTEPPIETLSYAEALKRKNAAAFRAALKQEPQAPQASTEGRLESLIVKDNQTYKLTPGKHIIDKLIVSGSGRVIVSGKTKLIFKGDDGAPIMLSGNARVNTPGDPEKLEIIYSGDQPIRADGNSKLSAKIKAPNSIGIIHGDAEMIVPTNSVLSYRNQYIVHEYETGRYHIFGNEDLAQAYSAILKNKRNASQQLLIKERQLLRTQIDRERQIEALRQKALPPSQSGSAY